jgi:signal transduction histidine kinase
VSPPNTKRNCSSRSTRPNAVGEGTGLGLSVSYDIIRSHNGRIGYRRGASGGAVFFFELPIVANEERT